MLADFGQDSTEQRGLIGPGHLASRKNERAYTSVNERAVFIRTMTNRFVLGEHDPALVACLRQPYGICDSSLKLVSTRVDGNGGGPEFGRQVVLRERLVEVYRRELRQRARALRAGSGSLLRSSLYQGSGLTTANR